MARRVPPRLLRLLVAQVAVVGGVLGYGLVLGQPMNPDDGLRQFDALTLAEPVPGLDAVEGLPTLAVAPGALHGEQCREQLALALSRRADGEGLPTAYGLLVLAPADAPVAVPAGLGATELRADPDGALARALALPRAASGCLPGYAVVDPAGLVRYRTYDPRWAHHATEQSILLDAAASSAR
jgi:hypothetical protein